MSGALAGYSHNIGKPRTKIRERADELGRTPTDIEWGVGVDPDDLDRFLRKDAPVYLEMGFTQFTSGSTIPIGKWSGASNGWIGGTRSTPTDHRTEILSVAGVIVISCPFSARVVYVTTTPRRITARWDHLCGVPRSEPRSRRIRVGADPAAGKVVSLRWSRGGSSDLGQAAGGGRSGGVPDVRLGRGPIRGAVPGRDADPGRALRTPLALSRTPVDAVVDVGLSGIAVERVGT